MPYRGNQRDQADGHRGNINDDGCEKLYDERNQRNGHEQNIDEQHGKN
jgi:hypothetical protein